MTDSVDLPVGAWLRAAARYAVAAIVAGGAVYGAVLLIPDDLDVVTETVGYPTWADFDVERYFHVYWTVLLGFPAATLLVVRVLSARAPLDAGPCPDAPAARAPAAVAAPGVASALRLLYVGAAWGFAVVAMGGDRPIDGWFAAIAVGAGALGLRTVLGGTAVALGADVAAFSRRAGAVTAVGAALLPLALWGLSEATIVRVAETGETRPFEWLPLGPPLVAACGAVGWTALRLARSRSADEGAVVEWAVVRFVATPVLLFVLFTRMTGLAGPFDAYHDGERTAVVRLLSEGLFPYRDLVSVHGLLGDVFPWIVGMRVEDSRWAALAAGELLDKPLFVIGLYLLFATLYRGRASFVVLATALTLGPWITPYIRYVSIPIPLVAFAVLVRKATPARAFAFASILVLNALAMPESIYLVVGCGLALVGFEVHARIPGATLRRRFPRTFWAVVFGSAWVIGWLGLLAANDALGPFVDYYRTVGVEPEMQSGIPMGYEGASVPWWFATAFPVAAVSVLTWVLAIRLWRRLPLTTADWTMAALAVFVVLFYEKGLDRADTHLIAPMTVSAPIAIHLLHRLLDPIEEILSRSPWGRAAAGVASARWPTAVLAAAVLLAPPVVGPAFGAGLVAHVPEAPRHPRLGYGEPGAKDPQVLADLARVVDALPDRGRPFLDLSNSPGVFHYALGLRPATPYLHIDLARRVFAQRKLVASLRRTRPDGVAFCFERAACGWDDVSNMVRNYEVTRFVFERYRPWIAVDRFLLLLRKRARPPDLRAVLPALRSDVATADLHFGTHPCDWGYAPDFLPRRAGSSGAARRVGLRRGPDPGRVELHVPEAWRHGGWARLEIALDAPRGGDFVLSDRDPGPDDRREVRFRTRPEGPRPYRVQVGSCLQWYGWEGDTLVLRASEGARVRSVALRR